MPENDFDVDMSASSLILFKFNKCDFLLIHHLALIIAVRTELLNNLLSIPSSRHYISPYREELQQHGDLVHVCTYSSLINTFICCGTLNQKIIQNCSKLFPELCVYVCVCVCVCARVRVLVCVFFFSLAYNLVFRF
jgi:hypothetical protein